MLVLLVLTLFLASSSVVQSLKLPKTFPLCRGTDPKLNECLIAALKASLLVLKNGSKDLQLLPLDPLEITKIVFIQGNGPVSLNLVLTDSKTFGLTNFNIHNISLERTAGKYIMYVDGMMPRLHMDADYVMEGKILILPVKGEGKCNITSTDVQGQILLLGEEWNKDGKVYLKLTKFKVTVTKIGRMTTYFGNLFNGDKALGDGITALMNENWQDFWRAVQEPFQDSFSQVLNVFAAKIFHNFPINEILLD